MDGLNLGAALERAIWDVLLRQDTYLPASVVLKAAVQSIVASVAEREDMSKKAPFPPKCEESPAKAQLSADEQGGGAGWGQWEANARPLKAGDVVKLKSGSPVMTLCGRYDTVMWQCLWFDNNKVREVYVRDLAALKRAD